VPALYDGRTGPPRTIRLVRASIASHASEVMRLLRGTNRQLAQILAKRDGGWPPVSEKLNASTRISARRTAVTLS